MQPYVSSCSPIIVEDSAISDEAKHEHEISQTDGMILSVVIVTLYQFSCHSL